MSLVTPKVTVSIGSSLPPYLPANGQVKNVMATTGTGKTMVEVQPTPTGTNPYSGRTYNLGSLGSGFCIQGSPLFNPFYGQFGAVVGHNLTGHNSHYGGNEVYIMPFSASQSSNLWKRMTNPYPDDILNVSSRQEYGSGGVTYTGPSFGEYIPDFFGKGTSGDHTRGHQVVVPGGTGGQGRVFYPKTASDAGGDVAPSSYGKRGHMLDCGVETGAPSYDNTKVWHTRALSDCLKHAFGGGCWYESDTGLIGYLANNPGNSTETQLQFFNPATNDWTTNVPLSGSVYVPDDSAVEYISSRKLLITVAGRLPYSVQLIDRTQNPSPAAIVNWGSPSDANTTAGLSICGYANVIKYCPIDGNFYFIVTQQTNPAFGASSAPQFWRFAPTVDLRTGITNAAVMASTGGTWTNITTLLSGDALIRGAGGPQAWGPYQCLWWHNTFGCFVWSAGPSHNVQLINPIGV